MQKVYFIAGLSNGETATEGKGNFAEIEGALSPWQRLLRYCAEQQVDITSLALATADGRRWHLPSAGKAPKFKAMAEALKPTGVRMFRKAAMDLKTNTDGDMKEGDWGDFFTCLEAIFADGRKLQLWVSDAEPHPSWCIII